MTDKRGVSFDKETIDVVSSLKSEQSREKELKARRTLLSALIVISYIALGCYRAIPGPTIYILLKLVDVKLESLMIIFTARSLGYICGYVLGGAAFDIMHSDIQKRFVITIVEIICGATAFAVPFCKTLIEMSVTFFSAGFTLSFLDTGLNTSMLHLWGRRSNPYFMALHFLYGAGGLVGPILARIFVQDMTSAMATKNETLILIPADMGTAKFPRLLFVYIVLSAIIGVVSVFWLLSLLCSCEEIPTGSFKVEIGIKIPTMEFTIFAVVTTSVLTFLCGSINLGYAHMLATYALESHNFSTVKMVDLTAFFWGFYTLGGLLSIFAALLFHPFLMIITCIVLELAAGLVLVLLANSSNDMLAFGNVLLGLGASALFAWTILWMDRYIVTTYKIMSALFVTQSLAEMIIPQVLAFTLSKSHSVLGIFIICIPTIYFTVLVIQCVWFFPYGEKFISLSRLPQKKRKRRFCPIFLENKRKGSDPELIEAAMRHSGISLHKPFTVTREDSKAAKDSQTQTDISSYDDSSQNLAEKRQEGIQVTYLTGAEAKSSLEFGKKGISKEPQKSIEDLSAKKGISKEPQKAIDDLSSRKEISKKPQKAIDDLSARKGIYKEPQKSTIDSSDKEPKKDRNEDKVQVGPVDKKESKKSSAELKAGAKEMKKNASSNSASDKSKDSEMQPETGSGSEKSSDKTDEPNKQKKDEGKFSNKKFVPEIKNSLPSSKRSSFSWMGNR